MRQRSRITGCAAAMAALVAAAFIVHGPSQGQTPGAAKPPAAKADPDKPPPVFDAAYMKNTANIKAGMEVWNQQCRHCHGASAYPGKAPKLKVGSYTPEFVFDRVAFGFKAMPPWKDVFTLEEIKAVVAYVTSDGFSP